MKFLKNWLIYNSYINKEPYWSQIGIRKINISQIFQTVPTHATEYGG